PYEPRAQRTCNLVTDHEAANRGRCNQLNACPSKFLRDRAPEALSLVRKLKHQRTLQVNGAVQTTGELKMTFQQRTGLSELIDNLFRVQFATSRVSYMVQSEPECRLIRT